VPLSDAQPREWRQAASTSKPFTSSFKSGKRAGAERALGENTVSANATLRSCTLNAVRKSPRNCGCISGRAHIRHMICCGTASACRCHCVAERNRGKMSFVKIIFGFAK